MCSCACANDYGQDECEGDVELVELSLALVGPRVVDVEEDREQLNLHNLVTISTKIVRF